MKVIIETLHSPCASVVLNDKMRSGARSNEGVSTPPPPIWWLASLLALEVGGQTPSPPFAPNGAPETWGHYLYSHRSHGWGNVRGESFDFIALMFAFSWFDGGCLTCRGNMSRNINMSWSGFVTEITLLIPRSFFLSFSASLSSQHVWCVRVSLIAVTVPKCHI